MQSADLTTAFSPLQIGPLTLRNRLIKSATNEGMTPNGVPSRALVRFHERIAEGGAALTTVAYCAISDDGRTFVDQAQLDVPTVRQFRALTDAVHRHGAAASAQITHGGCFTFLPSLSTKRPLSASGGFNKVGVMSGRFLKQAMTRDQMSAVADEFAQAARHARDAGFDAVEIHMGHGYLLSQFLSPLYNRRRDAYGGDAARRATFPVDVLRRVLDAVGRDLAVVCKIGVTEGVRGGGTADDACEIARRLEAEGAHLLVLSGGMNVESVWQLFGSPLPGDARANADNAIVRAAMALQKLTEPKMGAFREMYFLEHSRKVRAAVRMPLAYLGGVRSRGNVELAMREGFDAVALARALVFEPGFVNGLRDDRLAQSGCTSCNRCVVSMYTPGGTACVLGEPNDPAPNRVPAAGA
ncbi:TPA: NADH:flavin oxidoreductase [Burkholderia stabilis]|nr:NADH:flavin oxidoreductase [Burkholderia stabilis]HDR9647415.1 NADH:flavin oxidoreductase [Burkholderia stabilis]HDR9655845.1 NADH:flavin oxidoreductase [Burkholderia stabilis]HDR9678504.1 NADH:flavin oxidoreductase [Burkholderia stabilis]